MKKREFMLAVVVLAASVISASSSYADEKENFGAKVKNFWKNLLSYPARVTEESASVVTDTAKNTVSAKASAKAITPRGCLRHSISATP